MVLEITTENSGRSGTWKAAAAAAILFCIAFSLYIFFGKHVIWDSEAMYAEVPREMLASGNLFYPTLNYAPFLFKPPLYFWTNIASMSLFGQSILALRIPEAIFAAGTVVIVFLIGKRISLRAGIYSGAVLMTFFGFTFHTAMLLPDFPLSFFVATSILFFLKTINGEKGGVAGVYASLALAVMTKGFIGLIFPGAAFLTYMALEKKWHIAGRFASLPGIAAFLAITVPWHVIMEIKNPGFLYNFIMNEQILRFFNKRFPPDWDSVSTPLFIPITFGWLMPWSVFLFQACSRKRLIEARPALKLAFLWGLSGIAFLALTSSKMEYYSLPVLPAFAIIIGSYWAELPGRKAAAGAAIGAIALAVIALGGLGSLSALEGLMRSGLGVSGPNASGLSSVAARSFAALLAGGVFSLWFTHRGRMALAFSALFASALLFSVASQGMLRHITPVLSNAEAAKSVASMEKPGDIVVVDGEREYEYSSTYCFYLRNAVLILLNDGKPVLSITPGKDGGFLLGDDEFRKMWGSGRRIFFVTERDPSEIKIAGLRDTRFRKVFERAGRHIFINTM